MDSFSNAHYKDLCLSFIAANIQRCKLQKSTISCLLENYTGKNINIPDKSLIREKYSSQCYKTLFNIKN